MMLIFVILYILFCQSDLDKLENKMSEIRSLQRQLKQIVDDNPTNSVYCNFCTKNNVDPKDRIEFIIFDSLSMEYIRFYEYEYKNLYSDIVKIDSLDKIISLCTVLNNCCNINSYEYVNYSKIKHVNRTTQKYESKKYPTIDEDLTPDEMFSISSFVEIRDEVYKFVSARKFINSHKKDLWNIGEGAVGDSLIMYYQRAY